MQSKTVATFQPLWKERWNWWCTPVQHQQKVWPPQRFDEYSPHGPVRRNQDSCSGRGECCHHPANNKESHGTRGTLPGQNWWSSFRPQTDLVKKKENDKTCQHDYELKKGDGFSLFYIPSSRLILERTVKIYLWARWCSPWSLPWSPPPVPSCSGWHGGPGTLH